MANSISSVTTGTGGIVLESVDTSGNTNIKSGTTTIVAVTSTGAAVTGTLSASGNITASGATGGIGYGPAFSAYLSDNQSITTTTFTKIQFNTEEFDTNSNYDNATNYRFTPTVAGYYQVQVSLIPNSTTSQSAVAIYKNGSQFKSGNNTLTNFQPAVSALVYMNGTTDYLEGYGYLVGTTPIISGTLNYTYFQAAMVRSA